MLVVSCFLVLNNKFSANRVPGVSIIYNTILLIILFIFFRCNRWFIDYWMEEGLLRDIFTHKITTPEHWALLMMPTAYSKDEVAYDLIVGNATVTPSFDPHCVDDVSGGCHPVQIISAERLVKADTGPAEGRKIAMALKNKPGIAEWVADEEIWGCIWTELIINKKGLKTFIDREGVTERDYSFSQEMLAEMLIELDRLIEKYGSPEWNERQTAKDLVELFTEHRALIQEEHDEVEGRTLRDTDFLGPEERKLRKQQARQAEEEVSRGNFFLNANFINGKVQSTSRNLGTAADNVIDGGRDDFSNFFAKLDKQLLENRFATVKSQVFHDDMKRREWELRNNIG